MTPAMILAILEGVLGAAPQLLALFQQATAGKAVSATQVSQVLTAYGIDRAVFAAAIAKAEADAGMGQVSGSAIGGLANSPGANQQNKVT
jgi:hypothetical protein